MGEGVTQPTGELTTLLVLGGVIGGHHDGSEVAQIEVVHLGEGGVGPVPPLGGAETGEQPFGQRQHPRRVHLGMTGRPRLRVLRVECLTDGGETAPHQLLRHRALLLGQGSQDRGAVHPARAEPLGLGLGLGCGPSWAVGTGSGGPLTRRASGTGPSLGAPLGSGAATFAGRAVGRAGSLGPAALARVAGARSPIRAVRARPLDQRRGDALEAALRSEDLEAVLVVGLGAPRWKNGQDADAVHVDVGLDAEHVADLGRPGKERPVEHPSGLARACGPPGPRPVVARAGEFDVDPPRHGGSP